MDSSGSGVGRERVWDIREHSSKNSGARMGVGVMRRGRREARKATGNSTM